MRTLITDNYVGAPHAGSQKSFNWKSGEGGRANIFSGELQCPDYGYAITATGSNILLTIETGTSDKHTTRRIRPPARFVAYGSCVVYAEQDDAELSAEARVMVGYGWSMVPDVAGQETGPVDLQASAVAFRALTSCTLTIGGVAVSLLAGQGVELRGPASLDTGTGTVLYEP